MSNVLVATRCCPPWRRMTDDQFPTKGFQKAHQLQEVFDREKWSEYFSCSYCEYRAMVHIPRELRRTDIQYLPPETWVVCADDDDLVWTGDLELPDDADVVTWNALFFDITNHYLSIRHRATNPEQEVIQGSYAMRAKWFNGIHALDHREMPKFIRKRQHVHIPETRMIYLRHPAAVQGMRQRGIIKPHRHDLGFCEDIPVWSIPHLRKVVSRHNEFIR